MKTIIAVCLLALTSLCHADRIIGTVTAVHDGDTITMLSPGGTHGTVTHIRLLGIDAPELDQPWGPEAATWLRTWLLGKRATATTVAHDRYGRTIAQVSCEGLDVNGELLRAGQVWFYVAFAHGVSAATVYRQFEADARAARIGLWSDSDPQTPWSFRRPPLHGWSANGR